MKSKRVFASLLALVLILSLILTGCGKKEPAQPAGGGTPVAAENTKVVNGITMDKEQVLYRRGTEVETFDSAKTSYNSTFRCMAPIFEGLARVQGTPDGDKIEPGVAEKWESNADGTEWTFHLRNNALWSDGVPVKAEDFEYAIKRCLDPKTASKYAWFLNMFILNGEEFNTGKATIDQVGVKATDEKTLVIKLKNPIPYFEQMAYFTCLKPQRKDIIEKYGDKYGTEAEQLVFNGPFILKEWVHDSKLVYEKNPNYWDKDNVYLDKMVWNMLDESSARMQALLTGDYDVSGVSDADWKKKFDETGYFDVQKLEAQGIDFLQINLKDKYLKNTKIRQALSACIDREAYISDIVKSESIPGYHYVPPVNKIGDEKYQNKAGNPQFAKQLISQVSDTRALFIEGLKELGLNPDPAKAEISITMRGSDERTKQEAEWYQQVFREKIGFNLKIEMMEWNVAYDKVDKGEFQLFNNGWNADYNDPSTFLDCYAEGGYYADGFNDAEYNELIKKARLSTNNDERTQLFKRAEEILIKDKCVIIPLYSAIDLYYTRNFIKGLVQPSLGDPDYKGVYTLGRGTK